MPEKIGDLVDGPSAPDEPDPKTGRPRLEPVACWPHARRELFDEHVKTKSPIALQALEKIGAVFAIERGINGQSTETRRAVRQAPGAEPASVGRPEDLSGNQSGPDQSQE